MDPDQFEALAALAAANERLALEVAELRAQMRETAELRARVSSKDARIRQLAADLKILEGEVGDAERAAFRVRDLAKQVDPLRRQLAEANADLAALRAAKVWRAREAIRWARARPYRLLLLPFRLARLAFAKTSIPAPPPDRAPSIEISLPKGSAPPMHPRALRVGAILDEFSAAAFSPDCQMFTFRPDNFRRVLEDARPHLLLVESAWTGNRGAWQYRIGEYDISGDYLHGLVDWCRARHIPTVFWNKEDPVHFEHFRRAAALFDHVFTTDVGSVERYLGNSSQTQTVGVLPFAAQPALHNPIAPPGDRARTPCFAGTYYRNRDPERLRQLEIVLDAARAYDLVIYDRTFDRDSETTGYPERFASHVRGALPYDELVRAYKTFRVMLNGSSVADSPTMMSRRLFEILACGTAVVSAPNAAIDAFFGGIVPTVETPEEAKEALERLLHDDEHWRSVTREGLRVVHGGHTYRHRLAQVAAIAGVPIDADADRRVSALAIIDEERERDEIVRRVLAQSRAPDEIIIGTTLDAATIPSFGDAPVRVLRQEAADTERIRALAAMASGPWTWDAGRATDDADLLADLGNAAGFAAADLIARPAAGTRAHRYTAEIDARRAIVRRDTVRAGIEQDVAGSIEEGVRVYAADA